MGKKFKEGGLDISSEEQFKDLLALLDKAEATQKNLRVGNKPEEPKREVSEKKEVQEQPQRTEKPVHQKTEYVREVRLEEQQDDLSPLAQSLLGRVNRKRKNRKKGRKPDKKNPLSYFDDDDKKRTKKEIQKAVSYFEMDDEPMRDDTENIEIANRITSALLGEDVGMENLPPKETAPKITEKSCQEYSLLKLNIMTGQIEIIDMTVNPPVYHPLPVMFKRDGLLALLDLIRSSFRYLVEDGGYMDLLPGHTLEEIYDEEEADHVFYEEDDSDDAYEEPETTEDQDAEIDQMIAEAIEDDVDEETGHDDEDYEFCGCVYDTEARDKILTNNEYKAYLVPMNRQVKISPSIDLHNSDIYLVNVMIEDDDVTASAKLLYHFNASSDEDPSFYYLESDAFIAGSFGGKIYRDSLTGSIDLTENTIDIRGSELNYKACMIVYKKKGKSLMVDQVIPDNYNNH